MSGNKIDKIILFIILLTIIAVPIVSGSNGIVTVFGEIITETASYTAKVILLMILPLFNLILFYLFRMLPRIYSESESGRLFTGSYNKLRYIINILLIIATIGLIAENI